MIRIFDQPLPRQAALALVAWQASVDAQSTYAQRVAAAKRDFAQRNRHRNSTFVAVRKTLRAMTSGACRCMYCEDSAADEVEHFRPKDLYPEEVFRWTNYLYSCGPCNGGKRHHCAVFAASNGRFTDVTRATGAPVVAPVAGDDVLLHPRRDDPLACLELDLRGTFCFQPRATVDARSRRRASYTIKTLDLNRDLLLKARGEAYNSYRARLSEYLHCASAQRQRRAEALRRMQHPTVWAEMKRQHARLPELRVLFERAPEALDW